ncbi:MAG TPA: glycosyltransferase, partial [Acidimicrobiia bacterium]|nr:glycosyltransferase [Acidimicrobiia bacterium]
IRERLIRTLGRDFTVDYASREPGPSDPSALAWVPLRGGRVGRWLRALVVVTTRRWDVLVLHDPETIPIGLVARAWRRRPVVFDVHEDIPATALTRPWVPGLLRRPLASLSRWVLRLAERFLTISLAEPGYSRLFTREHPVFPNYPDTSTYPSPVTDARREVVHVGDVTMVRGLDVAVEACAMAGVPLRLVGPVADETRMALSELARSLGAEAAFDGARPNPESIHIAAGAAVAIVPWKDLPNYRDSLPTKLFEYLALGLPVVASDLPGMRRAGVEELAVVLVAPGDPAALAAGIAKALDDDLRSVAAADVGMVRERYRWPEYEVRGFYLGLVGRTGTPDPSSGASSPEPLA